DRHGATTPREEGWELDFGGLEMGPRRGPQTLLLLPWRRGAVAIVALHARRCQPSMPRGARYLASQITSYSKSRAKLASPAITRTISSPTPAPRRSPSLVPIDALRRARLAASKPSTRTRTRDDGCPTLGSMTRSTPKS